ncbi:MAG: protein-glutamate O-methyltransferase CheR [Candidatus Zixiibacteriota bacterium]|nr:MAG: protein-glutamate O-methyltransferase CheR [candidate division Zixibacteria bacterium]
MLQTENRNLELSREDFVAFRDFIHKKSGIFFAENKKYLVENRLSRRMATLGLKSFRDYFYQVKYDTSLKEFNMLMNLVTTNETSFYRNPPQLACFQQEVLPLIIAQKQQVGHDKRLKIWSAGCSTGEEPYTLGMILLEVLGEHNDWNIEIIANDISENVLYSARRAAYGKMSLRTTPLHIVDKYFTREGEKYCVAEPVKRLVKFSHLNLVDHRKMALMTDMDFVFCRNVMIYFSNDIKKQIVKGFYNSLRPGGYLYIGHAESLHGISKAFKLVCLKNGLVYFKETGAAAETDMPKTTAAPVAEAVGAKSTFAAAVSVAAQSGRDVSGTTAATRNKLNKIQELLASTRK